MNWLYFCRGHSFLSLNEGLLERYSECTTAAEVIEAQQEYLDSLRRNDSSDEDNGNDGADDGGGNAGGGYLRARDLPPSDSDEYEHSEDEHEEEESDAVVVGVQRLGLAQKESKEEGNCNGNSDAGGGGWISYLVFYFCFISSFWKHSQ